MRHILHFKKQKRSQDTRPSAKKNNNIKSRPPSEDRGFRAAAIIMSAVAFAATAVLTVAYIRERPLTTEDIASKVRPSVVGIVQYQNGSEDPTAEGSGIIISEDGYIVTNNHVVSGADRIEVVTSDGICYTAKKVGTDARTDLAVVKVDAKGLKPAEFGDSTKCRVGDQVIAIGNPAGLKLAGSVTQGIISAIDRDIDVGNGPMNLLQTDAAINPGNSGGALINMNGQVIGINSAKIAKEGFEGIGFSIPTSFAQPIVESLIKNGYVKGRVKLGLSCQMLDSATAKAKNLPSGVYVQYVDPKSSAAASGIKAGDIIVSIDNVRVRSASDLINERNRHKVGDEVTLTVYRRSTYGTLIFNVPLMEDRGNDVSQGESAGW